MSQKPNPNWIPWVLYPTGDLIAQLIIGDVSVTRLLALSLAGGLIYRFEVPFWFRCLDQWAFTPKTVQSVGILKWLTQPVDDRYRLNWVGRSLGAMSYFSPLWICRHMVILKIATVPWSQWIWPDLVFTLFPVACKSFLANLPFSILGNYWIQNRLPLHQRFLGSIIMTGLMSIGYALAYRFF